MKQKTWKNFVEAELIYVVSEIPQPEATEEEIAKRVSVMAARTKRVILGRSWFSVPKATVAEHVAGALTSMASELGYRGTPDRARMTNRALQQVYRSLAQELPLEMRPPCTAHLI